MKYSLRAIGSRVAIALLSTVVTIGSAPAMAAASTTDSIASVAQHVIVSGAVHPLLEIVLQFL